MVIALTRHILQESKSLVQSHLHNGKSKTYKSEGSPEPSSGKSSHAILNTDANAYNTYIKQREHQQNEEEKMETLRSELNDVKNEISEIKNLLLKIANTPT